jgi:Ribbon-helix-helix protein, copG family
MQLSPYLDQLHDALLKAASLADDQTRSTAERLGDAVESAARLALINALSDAAAIVTAELVPTSVEVRMVGGDPDLVVNVPPQNESPQIAPADPSLDLPDQEDEPVARVTLRLPSSVKAKVDELAAREGLSVNAWLLRAVTNAIGDRRFGPDAPPPPVPPWLGDPFGPHAPFGPPGVFGPAPFGDRFRVLDEPAGGEDPGHRGARDAGSRGVRGWAR